MHSLRARRDRRPHRRRSPVDRLRRPRVRSGDGDSLALRYARIAGHHGLKVTLFVTGRAVVEAPPPCANSSPRRTSRSAGTAGIVSPVSGGSADEQAVRLAAWLEPDASLDGSTDVDNDRARDRAERSKLAKSRLPLRPPYVTRARRSRRPRVVGRGRSLPRRAVSARERNHDPSDQHDARSRAPPPRRSDGKDDPRWEAVGVRHSDAWRQRVLQETKAIVAQGGVATILAHPLCMKVVDDWQTFERLCSSLSAYPSAWAPEAAGLLRPGEAA